MDDNYEVFVVDAENAEEFSVTVRLKSKGHERVKTKESRSVAGRKCIVQDLCLEILQALSERVSEYNPDFQRQRIKLENMILLFSPGIKTGERRTRPDQSLREQSKFSHIGLGNRGRLKPLQNLGFAPAHLLEATKLSSQTISSDPFSDYDSSFNLIYLFFKDTIVKSVRALKVPSFNSAENQYLMVENSDLAGVSSVEPLVVKAERITKSTLERINAIEVLLRKSWIREMAGTAVKQNLIDLYASSKAQSQSFIEEAQLLHRRSEDLLNELDVSIAKLGDIPLPVSLQKHFAEKSKSRDMHLGDETASSNRYSLLDCLDVDTKTWAEKFDKVNITLIDRKKRIEDLLKEIQLAVEAVKNEDDFIDDAFKVNWKTRILKLQDLHGEQIDALSELTQSNNLALAKELILKIGSIDRMVRSKMAEVRATEKKSVKLLFRTLKSVSLIQSKMQILKNRQGAWREGASTLKSMNGYISQIGMLPRTFAASMSEIARRRHFGTVYTAEINELAERVGVMRAEEVKRRESFIQTHGQNLPTGLFPAIHQTHVPHCEIDKKPFDTELPAVTIQEVEQAYAELVNSQKKSNKNSMDKSEALDINSLEGHFNPEDLDESFLQDKERVILRLKAENEMLAARIYALENDNENPSKVVLPDASPAYLELEKKLQEEKRKVETYEKRILELEKLL